MRGETWYRCIFGEKVLMIQPRNLQSESQDSALWGFILLLIFYCFFWYRNPLYDFLTLTSFTLLPCCKAGSVSTSPNDTLLTLPASLCSRSCTYTSAASLSPPVKLSGEIPFSRNVESSGVRQKAASPLSCENRHAKPTIPWGHAPGSHTSSS